MPQQVTVIKQNINSQSVVLFYFPEFLQEESATEAVKKWQAIFNDYPNQKFTLVWDCSKMQNYRAGARKIWQQTLVELKDQIDRVYVISPSATIKAGVYLMNSFTSYNFKIISSLRDLPYVKVF